MQLYTMYQMLCDEDKFIKKVLTFIERGEYEKVDFLLKNHPLQSVYVTRATILHYFVACGNEKITQYLVYKNYDINAQDLRKTTPLMIATKKKKEVFVKILLAAGADIMMLNDENKSALQIVFEDQYFTAKTSELFYRALSEKFSTYEEVAQTLINAGCYLYQACCFKNARIIKYMLERGLSISSAKPVYRISSLHLAVRFGDVDTVKLLLQYGADTSAVDNQGSTPLYYVHPGLTEETCKKVEILKILLNVGVPSTTCNYTGLFQLSSTLICGKYETIRVVLQSNIDLTAKDQTNERNVLHYLATNTNPGIVEELKQCYCKYDVNQVDKSNMSPLHLAVKCNNVQMVQFLLDQGANPNHIIKEHGQTPLYFAFAKFRAGSEDECDQCVQMLLQNNADPQCIITNGNNEQITIFDVAVKTNNIERVIPVIAHLVILEGLGTPIKEIISTKINSLLLLKKYFDTCQKLVRKKISGRVTLLQLLTSDKKKMVRYAGNGELMLKLKYLSYKQSFRSFHLYYYNVLKNRIIEGIQYKKMLNRVAKVICKILNDCFDEENIVIDKIIDYLNGDSLQQLYHVSTQIKM